MKSIGGTVERFHSLTSLRFAAALAVFAVHSQGFTAGELADAYTWLSRPGHVGVSFFFILSGFVLTWVARSGEPRRAIYRRRFARIYPAYVVALAAGFIVTELQGRDIPLSHVASTLTLTQAWIPDLDHVFALNGPSWTLSCEAFFYATFPFYSDRVLAWTRRTRWILLSAGVLVVFVLGACYVASIQANGGTRPELADWFFVHFPPLRLPEFLIGVLLAAQLRDGGLPAVKVGPAIALSAAMYGMVRIAPEGVGLAALTVVPLLALLAACATRDRSGQRGLLRDRRLVYLGQISYCFYLVHEIVLRVFSEFFSSYSGLRGLGVVLLGLTLSILAGFLLHAVVERPLERRLRSGPAGALGRPSVPAP